MKHSPAPWRTSPRFGHQIVFDRRGKMVADCAILGRGITQEMVEANARICSAAPDMLAVLKRIRHEEVLEPEVEREIDAVLAKAEPRGLVR